MKKIILILIFLAVAIFTNAQSITNVDFEVIDKKIEITYNISNAKKGQKFNITLWKSENNGSWTRITRNITGDYGSFTPTYNGNFTNRKITWDVLSARKELNAKVQFEVRASVTDPVPDNMVLVQGGTFKMGSRNGGIDEKPVHSVTVSSFYISKYEVTNEEFCKFLNAYGSDKVKSGSYSGQTMIYDKKSGSYPWGVYKSGSSWYPISGYAKHPVIYVTWYGANEYCKWLSQTTGKTYRLPTEAEWEYAARGGVDTHGRAYQYAGSNNIDDVAWYSSNSGNKTHPVGTKSPNSLGIYDMSGNVWEWCSDWYGSYSSSSQTNPQGASSGSNRVRRGGGWNYHAAGCRVADRYSLTPTYSNDYLGFRVCQED